MEDNNQIVHGLWIGDSLSSIEKLCIQSYQDVGHSFHLWCYNEIKGVPDKTVLREASTIIPQSDIFRYRYSNKFGHGKGSFAGFSDIFRYKLLLEHGGWWSDLDITCLKRLDFSSDYIFRSNGEKGIVGNLMKCPPGSPLMKYCYERAVEEVNENNKDWLLPINILNDGISMFGLKKFQMSITNEDSWPLVSDLLIHKIEIPSEWYGIHWMNEEWRRLSIPKNKFKDGNTITDFLKKHHIPYDIMNEKDVKELYQAISVWNYRFVNLKARFKWMLKI